MSKLIKSCELAEIVTGLLVKPEIFGELDSKEKHDAFLKDIGQVVANHCGGQVSENPCSDEAAIYVAPNDSLPSLTQNVWMYHDVDGWLKRSVMSNYYGEAIFERDIDNEHGVLAQLDAQHSIGVSLSA